MTEVPVERGVLNFAQMQEAREQAERMAKIQQTVEIANRRQLQRWAAIVCRCRPWASYERWSGYDGTPPQAGCEVHGHVMVTFDGQVI